MKENKVIITINKPITEVFEFTTNPKNTHKWIPSIIEETAEKYPPKIGTIYKNRGQTSDWSSYKVTAFEKSKVFALVNLDGNYFVRYIYRKLSDNKTEMEYFEWVKTGELDSPFTKEILQKLKKILEK